MKKMNVDGLFSFTVPSISFLLLMLCAAFQVAAENGAESTLQDVLESPAKKNKTSVHALQLGLSRAGNKLVSVGERGVILLSHDEGQSWTQANSVPVSVTLTAVSFSDPLHGWATGHSGIILATTDGGNNWSIQLDGFMAAERAMQEAEALIASDDERGERAKRNAGYLVKEGADKPLLDVYFADQFNGWAVGAYGLAYATNDGGQNWYSIIARLPNPGGKHLYKVLHSDQELIILGEQAAVFSSADNGVNYQTLDTPYYGSYFGGLLLADGTRLLYGLRGNVWRQGQAKGRWKRVKLGSEVTLTSGTVGQHGRVILADQSGVIFVSLDSAQHFEVLGQAPFGGITDIIKSEGGFAVSTARGAHVISEDNLVTGGTR